MDDAWSTIVRWLERNCPQDAALLRPPATESDLGAAEREMGLPLPPGLTAWWRRSDGAGQQLSLLPPAFQPYSVRDALASRRSWLEISAEKPFGDETELGDEAGSDCYGLWAPQWLPIAGEGGDDLFVDLRPGPMSGSVGEFQHDGWDYTGPRWPGVTAMLADLAEALATGRPVDGWTPETGDGRLYWSYPCEQPRTDALVSTPVTDAMTGYLPAYVPRDIDAHLRGLIAEGARFVLVTGPPLSGKTRTLQEAVTAVLAGWQLVPVEDDEQLMAVARSGHPKLLVWMDDMRADRFPRFLSDGIEELSRSGAVVAGTCLPGERGSLEQLATVVELSGELSGAELAAAAAIAGDDERIAEALQDPAGLVPALGEGTAEVRRSEHPS